MVLGLFLGEKKYLGIDIGSFSIKIVEVVYRKNSVLEVTNFGVIPIINFKQVFKISQLVEESLASIIKEFLSATKISTSEAVFNVIAPYVFPVNFLTPSIPERSLPQVIKFEAQKQIPINVEETEIEYRYIPFQSETQKNWLIFLTATPKTYFQRYENLARLTKLKIAGLGVEFFNLEPFFSLEKGDYICFDLGHSYSSVYLIRDGKVIYGAKINLRGFDFLEGLMNLTKLPEEKLVAFVQKRGFNYNPEERELLSFSSNFINNLASTINNEIDKIVNKFLVYPKMIYFTGGLTILPGFRENLAPKFTRYPYDILDLTSFVQGEKFKLLKEKSTIFSQALGVVFRKILS